MRKATKQKRAALVPNPKAKLFDQIREVMPFGKDLCAMGSPLSGFSSPTKPLGSRWCWRHPRTMGAAEVASFLSHLAMAKDVAASTQNQALNALVFLYEHVLQIELGAG